MFSFSISISSTSATRDKPLAGIEDIQQLLLLFNRKLQVGGDGVGKLCRLVHANGGDHGFVIQGLLQLDVLLKEGSDPLHHLLDLRVDFELPVGDSHRGYKKAIGVIHLDGLGPLQSFHQHLDVAVRHLYALDDVANGSHRIDVFRPRFIDACIVLGGEKYLPVSGQRLFQRSYARLAPHNKGRHHVREDHHVPNGHHGELAKIAFVTGFFCLCHAISFHLSPLYRGKGSCANDPDVRASTNQQIIQTKKKNPKFTRDRRNEPLIRCGPVRMTTFLVEKKAVIQPVRLAAANGRLQIA